MKYVIFTCLYYSAVSCSPQSYSQKHLLLPFVVEETLKIGPAVLIVVDSIALLLPQTASSKAAFKAYWTKEPASNAVTAGVCAFLNTSLSQTKGTGPARTITFIYLVPSRLHVSRHVSPLPNASAD